MEPINEREERQLTQTELLELQTITRTQGRCGSLQTHSGLPCRRICRTGYTVCRKHGARAPQTIAKAERLLAVARMPAVELLLDQIDQFNEKQCTECGYPRGSLKERKHMIMIAKAVLDRTGLGPRATIDINARRTDDADALVEQMSEDEREELTRLVQQLNDLKGRVRARLALPVIDVGTS